MKIRMKVHFAGSGFAYAPGDEVDRPDAEAIRLIEKGYAVPVAAIPVEQAVKTAAAETRVIGNHKRKMMA